MNKMTELDRIKALLRDDLYPGSKDWSEGSTLERVEWLLTMYQDSREDIARLKDDIYDLRRERWDLQRERWDRIEDEFYK